MPKQGNFSKMDCLAIATKIKNQIFDPRRTYKTSVFLCGKNIGDDTSIRYKLTKILSHGFWYAGDFELIFPEDIFEELLYGPNGTDLLSLENLLADSVDVVAVIPESAGSIAELGAFANSEKLRSKLICIIDGMYKGKKSFIAQGPVKLLRRLNHDAVVYIDEKKMDTSFYQLPNTFAKFARDSEVDKVVSAFRKMKKKSSKTSGPITLLELDRFLLPAIYVLEPVEKKILVQIAACATEDEPNAVNTAATALSMLLKKHFVELTTEGYKLTEIGKNDFFSFRKKSSRYKEVKKTKAIDNLRLEILNLKYRRKKLKV